MDAFTMDTDAVYISFRAMRFVISSSQVASMLTCHSIMQDEKDRMDIYHKIFEVARKGKLHSAPLHADPNGETRILDIGCGTGIWAIDMAE
jgi:2-polyprenyl-3-methyl-5-hydroxy-6-metoxy-1,4-benzoquinol methylase